MRRALGLAIAAGACFAAAPYDLRGMPFVLVGARCAVAAVQAATGDGGPAAAARRGGVGAVIAGLWLAGWYAFVPLGWDRFAGNMDGAVVYAVAVAMHVVPFALACALSTGRASLVAALVVADAAANQWLPLPAGTSVLLVGSPALLAPAAVLGRSALSAALFGWASLPWRPSLAVLALWLLTGAWLRAASSDRGDAEEAAIDVVIVQPNTGAFDGRRPSRFAAHAEAIASVVTRAAGGDAGIVVIAPEGAWPLSRRDLERALAGTDATVVIGASWDDRNTLAVVQRGVVTGRFDKIELAPLGERRVLGLGRDRYQAGDGPRALGLDARATGIARGPGLTASPLICYEDASPSAARAIADPVVILATNDSWLGPVGASAHAAMAPLLAVETGRYVVRAATSGPSGVIDPAGAWTVPPTRWVDGDVAGTGPITVRARVPLRWPAYNAADVGPFTAILALGVLVGARSRRAPVLS